MTVEDDPLIAVWMALTAARRMKHDALPGKLPDAMIALAA